LTADDETGPSFYLLDERRTPMLFGLHLPDAEMPAIAGIFAFMRVSHASIEVEPSRIDGPFFIGTIDRFSNRRVLRRRWDEAAASYGATHIATRHVVGERSATAEARSLIFSYDPPMLNGILRANRPIVSRPDIETTRLLPGAGTEALLHAKLGHPIIEPRSDQPR
jgi:hypothetical protein